MRPERLISTRTRGRRALRRRLTSLDSNSDREVLRHCFAELNAGKRLRRGLASHLGDNGNFEEASGLASGSSANPRTALADSFGTNDARSAQRFEDGASSCSLGQARSATAEDRTAGVKDLKAVQGGVASAEHVVGGAAITVAGGGSTRTSFAERGCVFQWRGCVSRRVRVRCRASSSAVRLVTGGRPGSTSWPIDDALAPLPRCL